MALSLSYTLGFPPDSAAWPDHWDALEESFQDPDQARDVAWEVSLAANSPVRIFESFGASTNLVETVDAC